jgi:hypothetical protein
MVAAQRSRWIVRGNELMRRAAQFLGVLSVAVLAACSSGGGPKVTSAKTNPTVAGGANTTSTTVPHGGSATAKEYFTDIAESTANALLRASNLATPGSPAEFYAKYLLASAQATPGGAGSALSLTPTADGYHACGGASRAVCYDYTAIQVGTDGKVAAFNVSGVPLANKIRGAGAPVTAGPAVLTIASSYRTGDGNLFVVVDVTNGGATSITDSYESQYVGADGHQLNSGPAAGQGDVAAGATATMVLEFDNADFGGRLHLKLASSACCAGVWEATLPVG